MEKEVSILEAKDASEDVRKSSYQTVNSYFQQHVNTTEVDKALVSKLVLLASEEIITNKNTDIVNEALKAIICCINIEQIVLKLSINDCSLVVKRLCMCIHQTTEKTCCHWALFALASQKLADTIIQDKCDVILCAVEIAFEKWQGQSLTVENESINVIKRLLQQAPQLMDGECVRWGRIIVTMVGHKAIKLRENALAITVASLETLKKRQKDLHACLKPALKQMIIPDLKALMNDSQQVYALKTWGILVQMFGKELHSSSNLNMVLPVVEMGLRCIGTIEPRIAALQAWQQLIDNFSLNPSFLQDPKMVKLVMQALKFNNAKNESLALEKVKVWWHYIWLLDNKLSANFDLVCVPLLQFCVYGGSSGQKALGATSKMLPNPSSPATPHLKLPSPAGVTQNCTFPSIQLLGCEALAHFLGVACSSWKDLHYQLDCLRQEVVTGPTFFIKQSTMFITTATDLFSSLGSMIPEWLVLHIWERLVGHIRSAIDSSVKLDVRDSLSTLLLRFQVVVLSRNFSLHVVLKMFKEVCSLPKKVLGSTAYSVGSGEMVNGTPALFLLSLLLTPNLLESSPESEAYHSVFSSLVSSRSGHSTSTLEFLQSALELLSSNSEFLENKETAWRLWSTVVQVLTENITQTNEVNQGDALESNFSCCVQSLTFPAKLNLSVMPASSVKTMLKTWSDLYSIVNRLAALVPSEGANCVCEEVAGSLLDIANGENSLSDSNQVDMFVQMCHAMVSGLDFPSLGNQSTFNISASPVKRTPKKKQQQSALENIHSVVHLLALLQLQVLKLVSESEHTKKTSGTGIQNSLNVLVDTYCLLFSHVTSSNVIFNLIGHLGQPIGELLSDASKKTSVKVFNNSFQQKLETLWQDLTMAIQSRYNGLIDGELLQKLSPLLEATFLHSRRQIKNLTISLWTSTFAKASSSLQYPESLRPVLIKVKAKTLVKLPGFLGADTIVVEETPVSQMTQTQAPEPHVPGMPSPNKIQHGSFLHKPVSPRPSRSPAKSPGSPGLGILPNSVKKNLRPLEGFDDGDFVVIKYSPKKKMMLTEHQKEMLKEKRALPAMYNSLENSVDASLMSAHFTTDTQLDGTLSETPTPNGSQPFSVFGSVIPPSQPSTVSSDVIEEKGAKTKVRSRKRTDESKDKLEHGKEKAEVSKTRKPGRNKSPEQISSEQAEKPTKENKRGRKKKNDTKESSNDSIVFIEESEELEIETAENIKETPGRFSGKEKKLDEIDLTKDSQVNDAQSLETQPPESIVEDEQEISNLKDDESEKSSGHSSVPQNVLGIITYTQLSSSKSSREQSQENSMLSPQKSDGSKSENSARDENSGKLSDNEPLSSWSRKLSQLSQSPKVSSQLGKKVYEEYAVSSQKRSRSPLKSPKRNKKKLNDENVGKGVLDKWVIRSPGKGVDFGKAIDTMANIAEEIIVANVSQTLVEETQSPSKFSKLKKKKSDKASPSIMETPPKNILENILVNFGHSNRKLFGSQNSNKDLDIVEDSNMVPGSPDAKTYKLNSPVLKLKKLTNEDIQLFSPSWKNLKQRNAVSHDGNNEKNSAIDKTSIVNDDFSSFKPLDENKLQSEIIDPEEVEHQGIDGKGITFPGSEAIFSEDIDACSKEDAELVEKSCKEAKKIVTETDQDKNVDDHEMEIDSVEESELDPEESSQVESQGESDGIMSQSTPSGKSRKRKQITPKKMSPEDRKTKKNSVSSQKSETAGSGRKVGARVKSKKMNCDENNEVANSQDKKFDKNELDAIDNSKFENSSGDKIALESKRNNLRSEENKEEKKGSPEKKSNTDETEEGKNTNLKLEKFSHGKHIIDKKKRKISDEVSKEEETGSKENKLDASEKDLKGKSKNSKFEKKAKDNQDVDKTNEKLEKEEKETTREKDTTGIQVSGGKGKNEKVEKGVRSKKKNDKEESEEKKQDFDLEDIEHQGTDGKIITVPGSEAIFSEDMDASSKEDAEIGEKSSKQDKKIVTETDKDKNEDAYEMAMDGVEEESELDPLESSQVESQGESEGIMSQSTLSGKSKKRKQITPKKMSPEDRKTRKKKVSSQNSETAGSERKNGARAKSKKINCDENNGVANSQDKKSDTDKLDGKNNSTFEISAEDKKAVESKRNNLSSEENKEEKKSNTDETEEGKNTNLKLEKFSHEKQNIDKKKRKMSHEVSKAEETGSKETKLDTSEKEQDGKSKYLKFEEKNKDKKDMNKRNEKLEKQLNKKQDRKETKEIEKDVTGIQDSGEKEENEKVGKGFRAKKKIVKEESEEKKQDIQTNGTRSLRKAKEKDVDKSSQKKGKKADFDNEKVQTEQESKGKIDGKDETPLKKPRKKLKMVSEQTVSEKPDVSAKKFDVSEGKECTESSKGIGLQDEDKSLDREIAEMKKSAKDYRNLEKVLDKYNEDINEKMLEVENDLTENMDVDEIPESTESQVEPVGEQTPDSKTIQLPERRSTAKHKKEVTQKLLKKRIMDDHIDLETATKSDDELPDIVKEKPKVDEEKSGEKECVKSVVRKLAGVLASGNISDPETISDIDIDSMDETPKKATKTAVMDGSKLIAYSDSKLVLGSRKFQKKGGLARRSILKTSSLSGEGVANQNEGPNFHPIVVSHIYSPTASPSASILKRKRFVEDPVAETNSPPSKQRRVSFATPLSDVDNSLLPICGSQPPFIPVSSELNTNIDKSKQDQSGAMLSSKTCDSSQQTQSSMGSPSQSHYESTQESQLNTSEPVYPDLVHCDQSVDKILPQLTSTIWHRGLGQLVRARNIRTIGDLASMSETDIHSLPIRAPKVDTVRDVLSKFVKNQKSPKAKLWNLPKASKTEPNSKTFSESVTKETEAVEGTQMDTTLEEAPVEAPSSSDQLKADSSVATESVSNLEPIEKVHRLIEDLKKLKEGERKLVQEFFMMMNDGASKK